MKNGIIMAVSALIIRCMAMAFRVFLSGTAGAEGMGIYQLVMSVYIFFAAVSTSGIMLCATRLFGEMSAKGDLGQARYTVERCIITAFVSGVFIGSIMFISSDICAELILHEKAAASALRLLAPSLPFMAASACIRGYFCARRKTLQTSVEQLLEQIIEFGTFALVFAVFPPVSKEGMCCCAVIGTSAAELVSFVYSMICYRTDIKSLGCVKERVPLLWRRLLPIALPVTANACLRSGLSAAENSLIPSGLRKYGSSSSEALAQYGIISGMSMTVLVFPSVFIIPFAVLVVPEIAEAVVLGHKGAVKRISEKMISFTLLYSIPVTVIFIFYSVPLCRLIFGNEQAGEYLALLAPVVPLMYLDSVVDGILKGLNEQTSYLIFNTLDSVIRVILTYTLLPLFGTAGVIAVIIISELLNTFLSLARLIKLTKIELRLFDNFFIPLCCIIIPCLVTRLTPFISVLFKIVIAVGFYISAISLTKRKPDC